MMHINRKETKTHDIAHDKDVHVPSNAPHVKPRRLNEDEMIHLQTLSTLPTLDDDDESIFYSFSGYGSGGDFVRECASFSCASVSEENDTNHGMNIIVHNDDNRHDEDDYDNDGNPWMSASDRDRRRGDVHVHGAPFSISVRSHGEEDTLDYDDDLISTGSLLSTVQRLKDMLNRAESTKLELSRQLAGTDTAIHKCHKNNTTTTENDSASASASTSTCSNSDTTPNDDEVKQSTTKSKPSKLGFGFFRRGALIVAPIKSRESKNKTTSRSKTKIKNKMSKALVDEENRKDDDDNAGLSKINAELKDTISKLQTKLQEQQKKLRELNMENNKLAETTARIEVQYMNKMHEMQRDFEVRLRCRDEKITFLTWELNALGYDAKQETKVETIQLHDQ